MGNTTEINEVSFGARHTKDFLKSFAIILVVLAFSGGMCFAKTIPEFESMKSLVGKWGGNLYEWKTSDGHLRLSFR